MSGYNHLRPYQIEGLDALNQIDTSLKSFVLPTGAGKTRVALEYAREKMAEHLSVAYIVISDAHIEQVRAEADAISVPSEYIPGRHSNTANQEAIDNREIHLQDYDVAQHIGVFSYAGYFHGSGVNRANILIIDDAHALISEQFSNSAVKISRENFNRGFDRVLELIKAHNPILSANIDSLTIPVHRGGDSVLIPPPRDDEVKDSLTEVVTNLTNGTGYHRYQLQQRLNSMPEFVNFPCVVTKDNIVWRPFILPYESIGQDPHQRIAEDEIVCLTSVRNSEDFLRTRLGFKDSISQAEMEEFEPMGTRIVIPYQDMYSDAPPSQAQRRTIEEWARRFGSVLVSMSSDRSFSHLAGDLSEDIEVVRYRSPQTVQEYQTRDEPRVLGLVNRPSGIDISSDVCNVAIHLDLPYSTSGHEMVAGDIEESGAVADASLAIRLSQLLGRLNRGPNDRSVHLLLTRNLKIRRGTAFVKSLDPEVLLDILIGQRALAREYSLPIDPELMEDAAEFLDGIDSLRDDSIDNEEDLLDLFLEEEIDDYSPPISERVEANLFACRNNFTQAARTFRDFSEHANDQDFGAHASFYQFQALAYAEGSVQSTSDVLERDREILIDQALQRNLPSSAINGALRQMRETQQVGVEEARESLLDLELKQQSVARYRRWVEEQEEEIPPPNQREDVESWKEYWRPRIRQDDHDKLVSAYCDIFELLGTDTPQKEHEDNDARISWRSGPNDRFALAVEVKGWDSDARDSPPELKPEHINQARDNADNIDAQAVMLFSSRQGRARETIRAAENQRVYFSTIQSGRTIADMISKQCSVIQQVINRSQTVHDVPLTANSIVHLIEGGQGGEISTQNIREILPSDI